MLNSEHRALSRGADICHWHRVHPSAWSANAVTVLMKRSPDRPIEIPWERLSVESQAMAEGLKRLKVKLTPKAPRLGAYVEGKMDDEGLLKSSAVLPRYLDGKWKNYNTVLESAVYDVALSSNGKDVRIWLKNVRNKRKN